jgi:hypothetical protein
MLDARLVRVGVLAKRMETIILNVSKQEGSSMVQRLHCIGIKGYISHI